MSQATQSTDKGYQGYANYETWAVCLSLNNNAGTCDYWKQRAEEEFNYVTGDENPDYEQISSEAEQALAKQLEDEFTSEEIFPDLRGTIYEDLLSNAVRQVDWIEVAKDFLSGVDNYVDIT